MNVKRSQFYAKGHCLFNLFLSNADQSRDEDCGDLKRGSKTSSSQTVRR